MNVLRVFLSILILGLAVGSAGAGELGDPAWGFKLPEFPGWVAQQQADGITMGSHTEPGLILVQPHVYGSTEALVQAAAEGWREEGSVLLPTGGAVAFGSNGVAANFEGTVQGEAAKAYAIGLVSPHGGGGALVLSLVASSDQTDGYRTRAEALARTIQFFAPKVPTDVDMWRNKFANARLTYLWSYYSGGADGSYAGGSQKTLIDLCSAGFFNFYDNNTMAVDGGFGSGYTSSTAGGGTDRGNGSWEVSARGPQSLLVLRFNDGRVFEYVLSRDGGKTYLDDNRYYVTYDGSADAEQAPDCW